MYAKCLPPSFVAIPSAVSTTEYECRIRYVDMIIRADQWGRLYTCAWDSDFSTDELYCFFFFFLNVLFIIFFSGPEVRLDFVFPPFYI